MQAFPNIITKCPIAIIKPFLKIYWELLLMMKEVFKRYQTLVAISWSLILTCDINAKMYDKLSKLLAVKLQSNLAGK